MNRDDFPILNSGIVYFDNGATTFKPKCVVDAVVDYYTKYTANAHRGDYKNSTLVDKMYEEVRVSVKEFINASSSSEVIFTKGSTESLNMVVSGFMRHYLKEGDEVLITKTEHASNMLPWIELEKSMGIVVKYIPLNDCHEVTIDNIKRVITNRTKVISIAHVTNVIGDIRPIEEIGKLCLENDICFVVDAAQSIGHIKIDVKKCNISFLGFSAHKMLGPTGVGVLYGKFGLLDKLVPIEYGGGMNSYYESGGEVEYKALPERLEAGTQNIAGVIGMGEAIKYLMDVGLDNIHMHEFNLKSYALMKLKKIPNIKIYNEFSKSGIIVFNIDKVFSQDVALFLNEYDICVRAGNHCAKIVKDEINIGSTCRISFYLYNTKDEIDKLIEALNNQDKIFDNIV